VTTLRIAAASLLVALIFYAGNLQSHTYIIVFAALFLGATFWKERSQFLKTTGIISASGLLGAALASPVLVNQVELYLIGLRSVAAPFSWKSIGIIPGLLAGFYPWMTGSFRTIDVSHPLGASGVSYHLFCGSAVFLIAIHYVWKGGGADQRTAHAKTMGLLLIGALLFIAATPLRDLLYLRCAALGGMGLIILAGLGVKQLLEHGVTTRKAIVSFAAVYAACALMSSMAVWFIYPRFESAVLKAALERDTNNIYFPSIPKLREFQVTNFANEVSLRNIEALTGLAVVVIGAAFLIRGRHSVSRNRLSLFLALGLIPLLLYHHRFRPKQDIGLWHRLLEGGEAQKALIDKLGPHGRLEELPGQPAIKMVFPNAMAALYGAHVFHGYSAVHLKALFYLKHETDDVPAAWRADINLAEPSKSSTIERTSSRFFSSGPLQPVILHETLNQITVALPEGITFPVIRTDTNYPGWTVSAHGEKIASESYSHTFSAINKVNASEISYIYQPRYLALTLKVAGGAALLIGVLVLAGFLQRPRGSEPGETLRMTPSEKQLLEN
jgi:hypothetical protein